jgi:hypothetical protein
MTSWCVAEKHRRLSLSLLRAMLDQPGYTFTNFSPTPGVAKILERCDFVQLDSVKYLIPAVAAGAPTGRARIAYRPEEVRALLSEDERKMFDDHSRYRCGQFAISSSGRQCYVVTVRRGKRGLNFADVLYASRPELLEEHLGSLSMRASLHHRTPVLGVDSRYLRRSPRLAYQLPRPSYFLGNGVSASNVAAIYSEIVSIYG